MRSIPINKQRAKEKLIAETWKFLVMVGYVWVVLALLELHRAVVLRQYNIGHRLNYRVGFALLNAVVLAKVMLVAEDLHVADGFRDRALFYLIILRSFVFSIILVCFDILEEVLVGMFHGKTFAQSIPMLGGGGLEGVLLVGVIIFVVLIPFFGYQEIARVMGKDELLSLMFTKRAISAQTGQKTKAG